MDIKIEKKKYLVPRKYWAWIAGGAVLVAVLVWLAQYLRGTRYFFFSIFMSIC